MDILSLIIVIMTFINNILEIILVNYKLEAIIKENSTLHQPKQWVEFSNLQYKQY